jgi:hypothetical protein
MKTVGVTLAASQDESRRQIWTINDVNEPEPDSSPLPAGCVSFPVPDFARRRGMTATKNPLEAGYPFQFALKKRITRLDTYVLRGRG